jgi:predicted MFS family arabinose efflux permease
MGWQDIAVLLVVGGALAFLVRRFFLPARRRSRPQQTFIPVQNVKRRDDHCH